MTLEDTSEAARIETESFARPWTLQDFEYEMTRNPVARYLVAERDGRLIGFAGAHIILDEGHVTNVVTEPGERGRGVGRALMRSLLQYAANLGARCLTLEVRASNQAAVGLYRTLGFVQVSVRKRYYEDNGEDALLMVCDSMPAPEDGFEERETVHS